MARTWTLNASELLRVVWETELDNVLREVTEQSVGRVAICRNNRNRNVDPMEISIIGRIDFVSKEGVFVTLKGHKRKEHVDKKTGMVWFI